MKNLSGLFAFVILALFVGLACKNNPLAKFTSQYNCSIAGEPEPKTSEDFVERAKKHAEMYSGEGATSFDDCALAALNEAIRLDPNNAKALVLRGYAFRQQHEYDSALSDFDKAVQIDPKNADAYQFRSAIYEEKGMLDKAIEDMTKAIENTPKDGGRSYFYETRAGYYSKKGDDETAVRDYTEAIRLMPYFKYSYSDRAKAYRRLGKIDLAEADEQKVKELEPPEKGATPGIPQDSNSNKSNPPKTISGGVLNGKAVDLPKPVYPPAARAVRASGAVNVQVTVDEKGDVISASAVSGHPLLRAAAVQAARQAKFSPTLLSGKPVKVNGVIVYNFVPE
jgi:TonB family protein